MAVLTQIRSPSGWMLYSCKWPVKKGSLAGDEVGIPAITEPTSIPSGTLWQFMFFFTPPLSSPQVFLGKLLSPNLVCTCRRATVKPCIHLFKSTYVFLSRSFSLNEKLLRISACFYIEVPISDAFGTSPEIIGQSLSAVKSMVKKNFLDFHGFSLILNPKQ